ncbi:MAG: clostripain-related cysteine peptidase, partial [bacterium]|nr:clostripain-related cysteine peptidase [bacterium]
DTRKWICEDWTSNYDVLTLSELRYALENSSKPGSGKFDVIAFDACLMQMLEVIYEIRDHAEVVVGSEETEPGFGYPYDDIFNDLKSDTTMTSIEFGQVIAGNYVESYTVSDESTQSAVATAGISEVAESLDLFALKLMDYYSEIYGVISQIRSSSQTYDDNDYIDLRDFCERVRTSASIPGDLRSLAADVVTAIDNAVIYSGDTGGLVNNSNGISIYYPRSTSDYIASYDNTALARDTHWDEYIKGDFSQGDDLSLVKVYPNPIRIDEGSIVVIENLPYNSHLIITNISGDVLLDITTAYQTTYFWETKNSNGQLLAAGIYIINVEKKGKVKSLKTALLK